MIANLEITIKLTNLCSFTHLHSSATAFIPRSVYLRPPVEVLLRHFCPGLLAGSGGGRGKPVLSAQVFPQLTLPQPQSPSNCWSLLLGAPSIVRWPHICADPPEPQENGTGRAAASSVLASCLHHHSKWLQAYLFHLGLVALTGYSDTWQLCCSCLSWAPARVTYFYCTRDHLHLCKAKTMSEHRASQSLGPKQ